MVVLAEEDDGRAVCGREDERFADIAFARRAVSEVGDRHRVGTVCLDAQGVTGCVKGLGSDDHLRCRHVDRVRVPPCRRDRAPHAHELDGRRTPAVGNGVLAVAREHEVVAAQRTCGGDLCRLLAEQRGPERKLALPLKRRRLGIDATNDDHVSVEVAQLSVVDIGHPRVVLRRGDALTGGCQELHGIGLVRCVHTAPPVIGRVLATLGCVDTKLKSARSY